MSSTDKEKGELLDFVERINPRLLNKIRVETPEDLDMDAVYHLSVNGKIREFTPRISTRAAPSEDMSIPRTNTTKNVVNAIDGYSATWGDLHSLEGAGYYVYALPFSLVVKPNSALVFDAAVTGERWIVGYNDEHRRIKPEKICELFINKGTAMRRNPREGVRAIAREYEGCIWVYRGQEVHLSGTTKKNRVTVKEGYYRIKLLGFGTSARENQNQAEVIAEIDKDEYETLKKESVSMESRHNAWLDW